VESFIQYELQQVYKLKQHTAGLKDQSELEQHILNTMNNMILHFGERYTPYPKDSINLYIDKSDNPDYNTEIFMDLHLTHYPLRDWRGMWSEMNSTVKSYNKIGKRNKHAIIRGKLGKHQYNTLRLPLMCCDLLEKKQIITFRENEHDLLMSMKHGEWLDERGMPIPDFFKLADELNDKVKKLAEKSTLPDEPDFERIDNFVAKINERIVRGEI
jgi:predicted nucleotidyltransferase